jgi:heme o synthase
MTVVEPTGRVAGTHAVLASLAMLPVSFAPALLRPDWIGVIFTAGALSLGFSMLVCSGMFQLTRSDRSARLLLRTSLLYLPAYFALLLLLTSFN